MLERVSTKWVTAGAFAVCLVMVGCNGQEQETSLADGQVELPPLNTTAADTTGRWNLSLGTINGEPVTAMMVRHHMLQNVDEERMKMIANNIDAMQIGVGTLLDQLAWAASAESKGYKLTADEEFQVEYLKTKLLSDRYGKENVGPLLKPSESDLRTFYDTNQSRFTADMRVATAHILVDSQAKAEEVLAHARGGEDFTVLVSKFSKDELTKELGGNQGWLSRDQRTLGVGQSLQYIRAAEALEVGEFTVFQSDKGWHVISVIDKQGGGARPFEEVYADLDAGYRREMFNAIYNIELYHVRRENKAQTNAEALDLFCGTKNHINRYFAIAMNSSRVDEKLEILRRLSFEYPDHAVAPQAQFMQAYFQLKEKADHWESAYSAKRVIQYYPGTDWAKAAQYLLDNYIDQDAKPLAILSAAQRDQTVDLPAPQEILELAGI